MWQVDAGPCPGRIYEVGAERWAVIPPGANYQPDASLLWFARDADHALQIPGDADRSIEALGTITSAISDFARASVGASR